MKKLVPTIFKHLGTVAFMAAAVAVAWWTLIFSYQPECPEEIVK